MGFFSSIGNFFQDAAEDVLGIVGEVAGIAAPVVGGFFAGEAGAALGTKLSTTFNQVVDRVFEAPVPTGAAVTPVTQQRSVAGQQVVAATALPGILGGGMTPLLLIGGIAIAAILLLK